MQLYCPACKTASHAAERCAKCGDRLVAPSELSSLSRDQLFDPPDLIEPTAVGRVIVGTVAALGLYLSFREMLLGSLAAVDLTDVAPGSLGNWALRAGAILVGALLAGAGRANGTAAGGMTGLLCGVLFLATDSLAGLKPTAVEAGIVAGVAAVALALGRLGAITWPGVVPLPPSKVRSRGSSLIPLKDDLDAPRPTPLSWAKVGLGVAVAVVGFVLADPVRLGLRALAGNGLFLGSPAQIPLVDFVFAGLALLTGGLIAGGGSGAGLRHGAVMGLLASTVLAALALLGKESVVLPLSGLLEIVGYASESLRTATGLIVVVVGLTTLGIVSGGFGGLLLPRLAIKSRRRAYQD